MGLHTDVLKLVKGNVKAEKNPIKLLKRTKKMDEITN